MSVIQQSERILERVKQAKRWGALLSNPFFWWVVLILVCILVFLLFIILIIMLIFFPFLLFGDEGAFAYENNVSMGPGYSIVPGQLDADGTYYFWPVPTISRISSDFGTRDLGGYEFHDGIDIANGADKTANQPVYAMADGTVTVAGAVSGYGQAIYIDHGEGLVTIYGHMDSTMYVRPGQAVAKGQLIGKIGAGKVGRSTGPHLHFQVEVNGTAVNPLEYVVPPGSVDGGSTLPSDLAYKPLNIPAMLAYLQGRNSALADSSTLAMIDRAGKSTNVNPYLLIAITGQEQSFVPKNNNHASQIVRNPWNVFGCWCSGKGATLTTEEAAVIAAKTIIKLSQDRPADYDPIRWLNTTTDNPRGYYAEDPRWWIGVSKFFKKFKELGG